MRPWERHQFWFFIAGLGLVGSLCAPWGTNVEIVDPTVSRHALEQSQIVRTRDSEDRLPQDAHAEPRRIPEYRVPSQIETADHFETHPAALSSRMRLMPVSWGQRGSDLFGEIVTAESELSRETGQENEPPPAPLTADELQEIPRSVWLAGQIEVPLETKAIAEVVEQQQAVIESQPSASALPKFNIRITPTYRN